MFENVECGMIMCDFTVLLVSIKPRTLCHVEFNKELELLSSEGLLCICKNDLYLVYDSYAVKFGEA